MIEISEYIINVHSSCKDAMKMLDRVDVKTLFIVDDVNKLQATVTDGDLRRFFIAGGAVDDCVINAGNKNPRIASNLEEAQKMYDEKSYVAIPIVKDGIIQDIFLGENKHAKKKRIEDTFVVINAGGKGTRLEPFTKVLPKPLIPVGEYPIIEHIMREYEKYSLNRFGIIVNYKKELLKAYFNELESEYKLSWYDEKKPLGTGGGLSLLKDDIKSTIFFTNCDILITADYESMFRYHKEHNNLITMVCAYKSITIPYGVVEMGVDGAIGKMKEKPELSYLTNTGMYIVEPGALKYIEDNVAIGFPDIIKKAQDNGEKVGVYPISEYEWMDMGQLDELEKMRVRLYGK